MKWNRKGRRYIWLVIALLTVILLGFTLNTLLFYSNLNGMVEQYLCDNNNNRCNVIGTYMQAKKESVVSFADSLVRMPERILTEDLLSRKTDSFGLDSLAVFDLTKEELSYLGDGADFTGYVQENREGFLVPRIDLESQNIILFAAPVIVEGQVQKVVVARQTYAEYPSHYTKNTVMLLVDEFSGDIISKKQGAYSTLEEREINDLLAWVLSGDSSHSVVHHGNYFAVAQSVAGTPWKHISMICYDDLIPQTRLYIFIYLGLALLEFLILIFAMYRIRKEMKRQESFFLRDQLTGGKNRMGFIRECKEALDSHNPSGYKIVCMNIAEFRHINEAWGENAGNRMLLFVYRMLQESLSGKESIGRTNVDYFLLCLQEESEGGVEKRIAGMIDRINQCIHKAFFDYKLEFKIGVCDLTEGMDLALVINNAVYVSKTVKVRNSCVFYDEKMIKDLADNIELDNLFYDSLANHDFQIYLQPKVPENGSCEAEALIRWIHPTKGTIFPNRFIPLFEQNGKILDLDLYVFEETCRIVSEWIQKKKEGLSVSVNISRYSLMNAGEDIYKKYQEIKEKYRIPDGVLEIELTETALIDGNQISFVKKVLDGFRSCGFRIALDDFGFAYSSLGILKLLEVDTIKLDRIFFVDSNQKSEKIVHSIIQLAHSLGMQVVAEGIEEIDQASILYQSGCDFIQGYVYSKPVSLEEFEVWKRAKGV